MIHLFDAANRASDIRHKRERVYEIRLSIYASETQCGSCSRWMKKSCPREYNYNGWPRGPSCAGQKCDRFEMSLMAVKHVTEQRAELDRLLSELREAAE